jgi:hypothetical protein
MVNINSVIMILYHKVMMEMSKLMQCQRENGMPKHRAYLRQRLVVQGHENSCFS